MEIDDAIQWLKQLREKVIDESTPYEDTLYAESIDVVLEHVRQMRSVQPCEWCNITGDWLYEVSVIRNRRKTHNGEMKNFCPNCGRKLGG